MRWTALLLAALLAGCAAPEPEPRPEPEPERRWFVAADGRWGFPDAPGRAAVEAGGARDVGAAILGEAFVAGAGARAAARVAAVDAVSAALLGGRPAAAGDAWLAASLAARLGVAEGDALALEAWTWPLPQVPTGFEMERVHPCRGDGAPFCALPSDGRAAKLRLAVAAGATDLRFHPDVVELGPQHFPAYWNGTFTSPSGDATPFAVFALDFGNLSAPQGVEGALEAGEWTVSFALEVNGTRVPAGVGRITLRTPGLASYDVPLLDARDPAEQTDQHLARASRAELRARVAGVVPDGGAASVWLAFADARELLALAPGDVTALTATGRVSFAEDFAYAAAGLRGPVLPALHARAAPAPAPDEPADGALLLAAPPGLDARALPPVPGAGPPALAFEAPRPENATVAERPAPSLRLLALPSSRSAGPAWTLLPGAKWPDRAETERQLAVGPQLLLLAEPAARAAGLDPADATYAPVAMESALGPRLGYAMGAVAGGPSDAAWGGAPLVAAVGRTAGARLVVPLEEGADPAAVRAAALEAWGPHGVAVMWER